MAKEKKVTQRAAVISLQQVEDWINEQEDTGGLLREMGLISKEDYDSGIHDLEDFRVKVEANPDNVPQDILAAYREAEPNSVVA